MAGVIPQVVEHLPSKQEALSSKCSMVKKAKKRKKKRVICALYIRRFQKREPSKNECVFITEELLYLR
jgi:hypothetical protein